MTTLPDNTEPSAEALLKDATLAAMVEVEHLGRHYSDAEGVLVIEIRTGRLNTIIKSALDRFRAAGVREERERCAQRLRDEANAAEPSYIVQSTFKAAIECLEAPPHD